MKRLVTFLLLICSFSLWLFAMEADFSGKTSIDASVSLPPADGAWKFSSATIVQEFEIEAYSDYTALYVNPVFRFNILDGDFKCELSEAYVDLFIGKFSFRAGRQKESWGTAEIKSAVNIITPSDMSNPLDTRKMGIDALKVTLDAFPFSFDAYWIPLFTASKLPAHLQAVYDYYGIEIRKPDPKLENGEFAARASAYTSAGDFALYGYYGWEDVPSMTGEYDRLVMLGASAAVPVGQVTLKGEFAWYPERDACLSGTAGIEWIKDDLTLVVEAYAEWDRQKEEFSAQVGGSVSYDLAEGDLSLSLSGLVELGKYDGAGVFGVQYSVSDELKLSGDVMYVFEGPDEVGTYGQFKDYDGVRFVATYSF